MDKDDARLGPADLEDVLPILNEISILGGLSGFQIREVFSKLHSIHCAAQDVVFRQGEEHNNRTGIINNTGALFVCR